MWVPMVERIRTRPLYVVVAALVLAACYVAIGRLTFAVSVEYRNVTSVVFAPEGIALAFAILFGRRVAAGVVLGQALLSIWSGPSIFGGVAIGLINGFECMLGATLFERWKISPAFENPRMVFRFVALVFLVLQPISATGGTATLWAVGAVPRDHIPSYLSTLWIHGIQQPLPSASQIPSAWLHWWIGNSVGQVLVAPLLIAWATRRHARQPLKRWEWALSAGCVVLIGLGATVLPIHPLLMLGLTYPLLVWVGLRHGLVGVTTANVLVTPAVVWAGASGHGFLSHFSVPERLTYVGYFVATACIFSLTLYSMFEDRRLLVLQLQKLVRQDTLVPLANRRHFVETMSGHLGQPHSPLSLALLDIDHFKQINDENGHVVGDNVLVSVAQACSMSLRDGDFAARIGGEEFAVVLPNTTTDDAMASAEALRVAIETAHRDRLDLVPVTVSIGLTARRPDDTLDDLMVRVDSAMYVAKRGGRNRIAVI